jgi:hypothetical protein
MPPVRNLEKATSRLYSSRGSQGNNTNDAIVLLKKEIVSRFMIPLLFCNRNVEAEAGTAGHRLTAPRGPRREVLLPQQEGCTLHNGCRQLHGAYALARPYLEREVVTMTVRLGRGSRERMTRPRRSKAFEVTRRRTPLGMLSSASLAAR